MRARRVLAGLVIGAVALVGITAFGGDDTTAEVIRVIDGDTVLAQVDGEETTIRLLNVDTPETKDPDQPVQCLGPEATDFLTERLPAGIEIELEYDEERTDRYDRTLAGVYESDSLVNAEIAAEGLGVPVLFEPNDKFLPPVQEASEQAQRDGLGLFAPDVECSLAGQLQSLAGAVDQVPQSVEGDPAPALETAGSVVEEVDVFLAALTPEGLPGLGNEVMAVAAVTGYLVGIREDAGEQRERAEERRSDLDAAKTFYDEEQERLEQERLEREREEREREEREREEREREEREQREREEQAERDRAAEEKKTAPPTQGPSDSDSGSGSGNTSPDGSDGGSSSGGSSGSSGGGSSSDGSSSGSSGDSSGGSSDSGCTPYGPEIPHSDDGGYTGKRYGMPGGKTFRMCS